MITATLNAAYALGREHGEKQGYRDAPLSGEWAGDFNLGDLREALDLNPDIESDEELLANCCDDYEAGYAETMGEPEE